MSRAAISVFRSVFCSRVRVATYSYVGESLYLVVMRHLIPKFSVATIFSLCCVLNPAAASGARDADLGTSALGSGDMDTAITYLTRGIQSGDLGDDALAVAYHHRALAHQSQGDTARAILDYTNAMQRGTLPGEFRSRALNNRAICFELLGDLEAALRDLNLAIGLKADYADPYFNRASVLRKMGAYMDSLRDYQRASANGYGKPVRIAHGIAATYEAAGDRVAALRFYRQALSLDPGFEPARERIAALAAGETRLAEADDPVRKRVEYRIAEAVTGAQVATSPEATGENVLRAAIADQGPGPITGAGFAFDHARGGDDLRTGRGAPSALTVNNRGPRGGPETSVASVQSIAAVAVVSNYGVQLGAYGSQALAQQSWADLSGRHSNEISGLTARIVSAEIPHKGVVYRLTAMGLASPSHAQALCGRLKLRGQACLPVELPPS